MLVGMPCGIVTLMKKAQLFLQCDTRLSVLADGT